MRPSAMASVTPATVQTTAAARSLRHSVRAEASVRSIRRQGGSSGVSVAEIAAEATK
jgi:hypothetical protein